MIRAPMGGGDGQLPPATGIAVPYQCPPEETEAAHQRLIKLQQQLAGWLVAPLSDLLPPPRSLSVTLLLSPLSLTLSFSLSRSLFLSLTLSLALFISLSSHEQKPTCDARTRTHTQRLTDVHGHTCARSQALIHVNHKHVLIRTHSQMQITPDSISVPSLTP